MKWLLPALLAAAQLLLWPGVPVLTGSAVPPVQVVAVSLLVLVTAAALCLRRDRPVPALFAVLVTLGVATWAAPAGQQFVVPGDALTVIAVADLVALFSVAARRPARTTVVVFGVVMAWQAAQLALVDGVSGGYPLDLVLTAAVYGLIIVMGRVRGRWRADRAAAARRLAEARQAHADAADAERRRLARELHDVTAHHLTSIVVNSSAAQMLGDKRPELRAEALAFARRTGYDTLEALRQLVAIMPFDRGPEPPTTPRLADLADDFRQLGQVITVDVPAADLLPADLPPADLPPAVAEAVHGIVREALTNTLRYAPGSRVHVRFADGELTVDNDGSAPGPGAAGGLGGGRGVSGMRDRAQALGGTLEAGPHGTGGWRVRAVLPGTTPARSRPRWIRSRWIRSRTVLDALLVLFALAMPLLMLGSEVVEEDLAGDVAALILLAVVAHAAPLLRRRQHPWPVLAAVALTAWLGPLLAATGATPPARGWLFLFGTGAEFLAVYSVAARGTRPALTWLAPLAAGASAALSLATLVALDPPTGTAPADLTTPTTLTSPAGTAMIIVVTAAVAFLLYSPFLAGSWLAGWTVRRRRDRRRAHEEGSVATALWHAAARAQHERARVAAGLREAVLRHAADVPRAAENADLPTVLSAARQSLAAMRSLLDGLNNRPATETPQPTSPPTAPAPASPPTPTPPTSTPPTSTPPTSTPPISTPSTSTPSTSTPSTSTPPTSTPPTSAPATIAPSTPASPTSTSSTRPASPPVVPTLQTLPVAPIAPIAPPGSLGSLAERLRAAGCSATVDVAADVTAAGLPTVTEVATCRIAEVLLEGVAGPAAIRVDRDEMPRLTVTGAPPPGDTAQARIEVLGGQIHAGPDRTVVVRLTGIPGAASTGTNGLGTGWGQGPNAGAARADPSRAGTDRAGTDRARTDRARTDRARTDRARTDRARTDRASTDRASTDRASTNGISPDRGLPDLPEVPDTVREPATTGPAVAGHTTTGPTTTGPTTTGPTTTGPTTTGTVATEPATTGSVATGHTTTGPTTTGSVTTGPATTGFVVAEGVSSSRSV
ncbi:histidine kinase [Actinoplanes sp. NPDC051494]|uniref:ATP-binding protein n=1 Tax=Actinoplanes sp. NPDC051494 TaxID=3363907 RepID=UPI0037BBEC71